MVRRWIIRGFFMLMLAVCVTVWMGSYFECVRVQHIAGGHYRYLELSSGLAWHEDGVVWQGVAGWHVDHWEANALVRAAMWDAYRGSPYHFMGFAWRPLRAPFSVSHVVIPLYFPTLLSAVLLWFVWRKTPRNTTARGFQWSQAGRKRTSRDSPQAPQAPPPDRRVPLEATPKE